MMLFRNFRIRRYLCGLTCENTADTLIVVQFGNGVDTRKYYCAEHAVAGACWARDLWPHTHRIYKDTGARRP